MPKASGGAAAWRNPGGYGILGRAAGTHCTVVRFEDVAARYGQGPKVLPGLNCELAQRSFHFLTGASGAGKSTLLKLLYRALKPTRGRITLFDREVALVPRAELPGLRRRIGVVFQEFRLLPHLSALDNVALPLRVAGAKENQIRDHVAELLAWVGLGQHVHDLPPTLSGGQQQRIAIARAVIGRPSLLLADEPTGNVDHRIAGRPMYLFDELNKMGTSVVIATHNDALVARFKHPELHLESGQLYAVPARR